VTDGDDRVNPKVVLDDTATVIAAPVMAARTPRVIRRGIMVSSRLSSNWKFRVCRRTGLKRRKSGFVLLFHQKDREKFDAFPGAVATSHGLETGKPQNHAHEPRSNGPGLIARAKEDCSRALCAMVLARC
jgi:hypothetical protein